MGNWGRFLDRYYGINFLIILSYFVLRCVKSAPDLQRPDDYLGLTKEQNILAMLTIGVFTKLKKTATVDEFVARAILFGKTAVVILLWFIDKRIMAWYMIVYAVLFFTLHPPEYEGPADVVHLNPMSFKRKIEDGEGESEAWLVYCYADWCSNCGYFAPMIADLSMRYGSDKLSFGKIDVGRYAEMAERLTIDTGAASTAQLPSLILFKKGQEINRLPQFKSDGQVIKTVLDEKGIIAVFELDKKGADKNPKKAKSKDKKKK